MHTLGKVIEKREHRNITFIENTVRKRSHFLLYAGQLCNRSIDLSWGKVTLLKQKWKGGSLLPSRQWAFLSQLTNYFFGSDALFTFTNEWSILSTKFPPFSMPFPWGKKWEKHRVILKVCLTHKFTHWRKLVVWNDLSGNYKAIFNGEEGGSGKRENFSWILIEWVGQPYRSFPNPALIAAWPTRFPSTWRRKLLFKIIGKCFSLRPPPPMILSS